jgi:lactate permease
VADEEAAMYTQVYDPIASSLGWSSLVAALPLLSLFLLLGVLRWKAQWAGLASTTCRSGRPSTPA